MQTDCTAVKAKSSVSLPLVKRDAKLLANLVTSTVPKDEFVSIDDQFSKGMAKLGALAKVQRFTDGVQLSEVILFATKETVEANDITLKAKDRNLIDESAISSFNVLTNSWLATSDWYMDAFPEVQFNFASHPEMFRRLVAGGALYASIMNDDLSLNSIKVRKKQALSAEFPTQEIPAYIYRFTYLREPDGRTSYTLVVHTIVLNPCEQDGWYILRFDQTGVEYNHISPFDPIIEINDKEVEEKKKFTEDKDHQEYDDFDPDPADDF